MHKLRHLINKYPFLMGFYRRMSFWFKYPQFQRDFKTFKSLVRNDRFEINWADRYPCFDDKTSQTPFDRHYVYHTAWAARVLAATRPLEHYDISSYIYFATLISAFIPVKFYDYRPALIELSGLQSGAADLLALPFADNTISSLSCMHVVEHVGLGRYGDPFDPDGDLKAIQELVRVLAKGGNLLFVVPVGKPKIMFNAHRTYAYEQILDYFSALELIEFCMIPDRRDGNLILNADPQLVEQQEYACGCFWFQKRKG